MKLELSGPQTWIITSDLHLTADPLDEYRWNFFPWLRNEASKLPGKKRLFILGDLTVDKDRHPAILVNRAVDSMTSLKHGTGIEEEDILRANHDGLGDVAYFEFMKYIPGINVIVRPEMKQIGGRTVALLPHTKSSNDWATIELGACSHIFMHQTLKGSIAENGIRLEGDGGFEWLKEWEVEKSQRVPRIWSGDVHVPQTVGYVNYVGAPYPIHFGDSYKGRVVVLQGDKVIEWHYPTIRKLILIVNPKTLPALDKLGLLGPRKGDQIKVEIELGRSEMHEFQRMKDEIAEWANRKGVVLCASELKARPGLSLRLEGTATKPALFSPHQALNTYIQRSKTPPPVAQRGRELLSRAAPEARRPSLQLGKPSLVLQPKLVLKSKEK